MVGRHCRVLRRTGEVTVKLLLKTDKMDVLGGLL
jgi:hypothetical protein